MKRRMTREEAMAWKARWELVNAFREMEEMTPCPEERSRKWNALQTMLEGFDWAHARPEERATLLSCWRAAVE